MQMSSVVHLNILPDLAHPLIKCQISEETAALMAKKTGRNACPFNYLYWGFLIRNETLLTSNHRTALRYRAISSWNRDKREQYRLASDNF